MRIWQKIYVATLLLFLILQNIGLFSAAGYVFSYNLKQEQKKTQNDCYFLCQNLEHDFSVLEQNARYREEVVRLLFEGYRSYYHTQNIELSLEITNEALPPAMSSDVKRGGGKMYMSAEKNLSEPYQLYRIRYQRRLSDFEKTWRSLQQTFAVISLLTSVLLCLLLYILMYCLLRPLGKLNERVARVANGEYGQNRIEINVPEWKKDEIYELSKNIGEMSDTIKRQIETLKDENNKKQQLMDNMAHELRTPLTSIYGYAEFIRYAKTKEEEKLEGLAYIMEESMRLAKMSETMLSMRLFEKEQKQKEPVQMQSIALHTEKILSSCLQEKKILLRKNFEVDTVYGEEELFINLFRNILENAVRASKEGDEIVWNAFETEKKQIFEIIDCGIGMRQEEIKRITEAFYRVDKARSRREGGVGLGLSVSDLIVKRLGGTMMFSSELSKGTKVTIVFTTS